MLPFVIWVIGWPIATAIRNWVYYNGPYFVQDRNTHWQATGIEVGVWVFIGILVYAKCNQVIMD